MYGFRIQHSLLSGHEIETIRVRTGNWAEQLAFCLLVLLPLGLVLLFPGQLWIGGTCLALLLPACFLSFALQIRYKPHFDLPKRFFYRGIDRFDCSRGQFDRMQFEAIRALQIIPTGKKEHCQLVALLHDGSRKLLLHGEYRSLLRAMIYENIEGKAVFPSKPSPCFLNAVAPIWDGAQFPLPYTPAPAPVRQEPYLPPNGIRLFAPEELEKFNRGYKEQGYYGAIAWTDAGFQPLPLHLCLDTFEDWPEKLHKAGIKTTVRTADFGACCERSFDAEHFDGFRLDVEFEGNPHVLLFFLKLPFKDSARVEAFFYAENTELLHTLKHAGLEEQQK